MMKLIFKNILLLLLFSSVATTGLQASIVFPPGKTEFTKTIKKDYKISADGNVTLTNKYGHINLKTWNKNEVNIEITITVKTKSESAANDVFDRINIDFANGSSYVKAETNIESQKSNWWGNGDKGDFQIDYEVSMPSGAGLYLHNKYGDADIDAIGGDASIAVKYGNFMLESVKGDTEINLGYGNGTVGNIKGGTVNIKYSKIKIKEASHLNVESKYSKIYIEKADKIKSLSKYDNYDLGELNELSNQGKYDHFEIEKLDRITAYAKYSDFKIEELYKDAEFELRYGGVMIEHLKQGFDKISLDCEYTDCKIYLDDSAAFQLDAAAEHASIRYPGNMEVTYEKQKGSSHAVQGYRGSAGAGKIKARLSYGGLKVK